MKVDILGRVFKIYWKHDLEDRSTTCVVEEWENDEKIIQFEGYARMYHTDKHYEKEIGRKVSLRKAIEVIDRNTRREIWNAYFVRRIGEVTIRKVELTKEELVN